MSDYTKIYDGAAKDTAKSAITGADFDVEFAALEVAVATKANKVSGHTTNSIGLLDVNGNPISSEVLIDTDGTLAGNSDSAIPTEKAVKTYVDTEVAGAGIGINYQTVQTITSGSDITFTGIPAAVDRVTIMIEELINSAYNTLELELGDATSYKITAGNYSGVCSQVSSVTADATSVNDNINIAYNAGGTIADGVIQLHRQTGNVWVVTSTIAISGGVQEIYQATGSCDALISALTRVRFRGTNGTGVYSAGKVNLYYE